MKKSMFILALGFGVSCANAQKLKEADVPAAVKSTFTKQYSTAKVDKWDKEDANYEVSFEYNKVEMSLLMDASGKVLENEAEIETSELPKSVTDYVAKNYAGYKLDEAAKITDAAGVVTFEAEMKKGKEEFDAVFDSSGTFIKKVVEPTDKDKDKD